MRTLKSKVLFQIFYLCLLVFGGTFLLGAVIMVEEGNTAECLLFMILCLVLLLYSGLLIRYYMKANKIIYGNDKIFIYRRSGDIGHYETTKMSWKQSVDCVNLEEVLSYGYAKEMLGYNLELHQFNIGTRPHDGEMFYLFVREKSTFRNTLSIQETA